MPYLPPTDHGYSVHAPSGTVHLRYADHGQDLQRTSMTGVYNVLDGREPTLCEECFPPVIPKSRAPKRSKPKANPPMEVALEEPSQDEPVPDAATLAREAGYEIEGPDGEPLLV